MAQGLKEDGTDRGTVVPKLVEKEGDMKQVNGIEKLTFPKDFKELESRLSTMDAKLREVSHKYFLTSISSYLSYFDFKFRIPLVG